MKRTFLHSPALLLLIVAVLTLLIAVSGTPEAAAAPPAHSPETDPPAKLHYIEPPAWHYPARHNLGAALLKAGQAAEAEAVYREDLRLVPTDASLDAAPLFWLRFNEGEPGSFSLLDANGAVLDSGLPGENRRLESEVAALDLATSSFSHDGPDSPTLTLTLALSFKPSAAGQVFDIEALAGDDLGNSQGPEGVGVWEVQSAAALDQNIYLPLILR